MPNASHDRSLPARVGRFLRNPWPRLAPYWFRVRGTVPFRLAYALRRPFAPEPRTLYFFPETPRLYNSVILRVCALRGIRVAPGTAADWPLISWEDRTVNATPAPAGALNARCTDIRKSTVDRLHRETFGYSAAVDPLTWRGALVEKSDQNAVHDGVVLDGPLAEAKAGKIYQRFLDNTLNGIVQEFRFPVVLGTIPYVTLCWKPPEVRFERAATRAKIVAAETAFSADEIDRVIAFCGAIGLDCGEIDAVRDPVDGRLYVLDANKTPVGPVRALPLWRLMGAVALTGRALDRLWLRPGGAPIRPRSRSDAPSGSSAVPPPPSPHT